MSKLSFQWKLGAAAILALLPGCGVKQQLPQLSEGVTHDSLHAAVSSICLLPLGVDQELMSEKRRTELQQHLVSRLQAAGFQAVMVDPSEELWKKLVEEVGGYYDRHTGRPDHAQHARILESYRRSIASENGCQAFLTSTVEVVSAPWFAGTARWDGAEQKLPGTSLGTYGYVGALSLWVRLEDVAGKEFYFGTGGITIVSRLEKLSWYKSEFRQTEMDQWLSDESRNIRAVDLALSTLVGTQR